ncbi:hypothetical protein [Allonocardiopsis opalescens]|uniref:Uncharacterized protein n=1 Tax=Allonocardiopsis opalescens TaxID=1144618 RepID=A0A2T0QCC5_9ACTN|nr:hypothetical protein [Allonocardiopsis opalescens]PRY01604.1 hypothetical protein CLV72_101187 [Allonocardiopsis opalescens]
MDLVWSWLAGLGALVVGLAVAAPLSTQLRLLLVRSDVILPLDTGDLDSQMMIYGPLYLVVPGLAALVAGLVHRRPERARTGRNALAALALPALLILLLAVEVPLSGFAVDWRRSALTALLFGIGAPAGWLLGRALRRPT